jgi:hypothetical protein
MDGNNKNNFRLDPLPPYAGFWCSCEQCSCVQCRSSSGRLNRELESCAWLVVWLAAIPYQLANVARRMGASRAHDLLAIGILLDTIRQYVYPTLHERKTLLPSHHAIAGCAKGIQTRLFIQQAR